MENPIKTHSTLIYQDIEIPEELRDEVLYLSTKTELVKDQWRLYLIHGLNIAGKPQNFEANYDIDKKEIGICKDLNNIKLALFSNASRFNNGDISSIPSKVKYSVILETSESIWKKFDIVSTEINPASFHTLIKFKMQS